MGPELGRDGTVKIKDFLSNKATTLVVEFSSENVDPCIDFSQVDQTPERMPTAVGEARVFRPGVG